MWTAHCYSTKDRNQHVLFQSYIYKPSNKRKQIGDPGITRDPQTNFTVFTRYGSGVAGSNSDRGIYVSLGVVSV